jgi:hypothetical protein
VSGFEHISLVKCQPMSSDYDRNLLRSFTHSSCSPRSVEASAILARGSATVFNRLLLGQEFLVNVYEGGEVDVHLVDSTTSGDEKSSVVMLSIGRPVLHIAGSAIAGPTGPVIQIERVEAREPEPREPGPSPPPAARA